MKRQSIRIALQKVISRLDTSTRHGCDLSQAIDRYLAATIDEIQVKPRRGGPRPGAGRPIKCTCGTCNACRMRQRYHARKP